LLLLLPLVAACGFNAQTDQDYQAAVGPNDRSGQIDVLNALIVSDQEGQGTFAGTLVNKSTSKDGRLVSVSGATLAAPIKIRPESAVNLAESGAVHIEEDSIKPGVMVPVTLRFESGQTTEMTVPVVGPAAPYDTVPLSPSASATPSR